MEVLKLAFDTLIVGALALPWLALLVRNLVPETKDTEAQLVPLSALPKHTKEAVLSVVILALGYFLGSAVCRISDDFFGDKELSQTMPTEPSIREAVYYHEYCYVHPNVIESKGLPKPKNDIAEDHAKFCPTQDRKHADPKNADVWWSDAVIEFFRLQEGKVLLQGEDKTPRLRELHGQIVILRGAALNGIVLSSLFLFGFCGSFRRRSEDARQAAMAAQVGGTAMTDSIARASDSRWWKTGLTYAAAVALIAYGGYCSWNHFQREAYHDPPLAEGVMILLGIAGLLARAPVESRWRYARGCGLSSALTLVAYGAWWWTEVIYSQIVIHLYSSM
jgi:hypothetical protein